MTSRQRMLCALNNTTPDVLPVTTHHIQPYYLKKYQNSSTVQEFFDKFGFDSIKWHVDQKPNKNEFLDETQKDLSFLEYPRICSDNWRISKEVLHKKSYHTVRYAIHTPIKTLYMTLQSNDYTTWIIEYPIKEKKDIEVLVNHLTMPIANVASTYVAAKEIGDKGIVRSFVPSTIELYGQPGVWQDACCLFGVENMIMQTYDDEFWVHELLSIIKNRKMHFIKSLKGSAYDVVELGGGDGCTSVISPKIFETFVAPYDTQLIACAHENKQRISYHLCGMKMPLLDMIGKMGMDAIETLTPVSMGGDSVLSVIKEKLGKKMCLIGGFDQNTYFKGTKPNQTAQAVKKCFMEAGEGGGFIIAPSDHFFDADDLLLKEFVKTAHSLRYE